MKIRRSVSCDRRVSAVGLCCIVMKCIEIDLILVVLVDVAKFGEEREGEILVSRAFLVPAEALGQQLRRPLGTSHRMQIHVEAIETVEGTIKCRSGRRAY